MRESHRVDDACVAINGCVEEGTDLDQEGHPLAPVEEPTLDTRRRLAAHRTENLRSWGSVVLWRETTLARMRGRSRGYHSPRP